MIQSEFREDKRGKYYYMHMPNKRGSTGKENYIHGPHLWKKHLPARRGNIFKVVPQQHTIVLSM